MVVHMPYNVRSVQDPLGECIYRKYVKGVPMKAVITKYIYFIAHGKITELRDCSPCYGLMFTNAQLVS